jgi:hypothetical protein
VQFTTPSQGAGMQASNPQDAGMLVLSTGDGILICLRSPDPTILKIHTSIFKDIPVSLPHHLFFISKISHILQLYQIC